MKKKVDVTIKCNDKDTFLRYVSPEYNKIVGNFILYILNFSFNF